MTCLEVAQSACAGLVYLHDKYAMEIIHRDKGEKSTGQHYGHNFTNKLDAIDTSGQFRTRHLKSIVFHEYFTHIMMMFGRGQTPNSQNKNYQSYLQFVE